jgi:hypothetical protein
MKKKLSPLLFALLFAAACEQPAGIGGYAPSITVNSAADLAKIGKDSGYPLNGKYSLGSDLALADWTPIGTAAEPFAGTFNGNNRTLAITGSGGA